MAFRKIKGFPEGLYMAQCRETKKERESKIKKEVDGEVMLYHSDDYPN